MINDCRLVDKSQAQLLLSSSAVFCNESILEAASHQASLASEDGGLFVLAYIGYACDSREHGLGFDFKKHGSILDISILDNWKRYVLMCDSDDKTSFSGDLIGEAIKLRKPKQVFVILECPFAAEIASDMRETLSDFNYIEVVVSIDKKKPSCFYHTLKCSTFAYFFNLVLKRTSKNEVIPIEEVMSSVKKCCQALSSLELIQVGEWIKKNTTVPQVHLVNVAIIDHPDFAGSERNGDVSGNDEAGGQFQPLIEKHYQWNKSSNRVKVCSEAIDWVKAVTKVNLSDLKDEGVLEDETVLEAVIGSMVFSITTVQMAMKHKASFPNFFLQAFMLSASAIDFVDPGSFNLVKDSLVKGIIAYYKEALKPYTKKTNDLLL